MTVVAIKYAPPPPKLWRRFSPKRMTRLRRLDRRRRAAKLEALTVEGRSMTAPEDVLAALDVQRGSPIMTIDVAEARAALEALPWVKAAQVERQLPNTVHVMIQERAALRACGSKAICATRWSIATVSRSSPCPMPIRR